jgi:uncharacterized protein (TIGR00255 family)
MIASMTGFGSGAVERDGVRVRASLRSVNSRFCDIQVRCPNRIQELEPAIKERLQGRISRGKVTVALEWEEEAQAQALPVLDEEVARAYLRELDRLRQLGGLPERSMDLALVAGLPGLFRTGSLEQEPEQAAEFVLQAVDLALQDFEQMRAAEGAALAVDLQSRVAFLEERLERIEELAVRARSQYQARLREKVEALLRPGEVDEDRLAMEVALLAERSDIAEEIVRFRSHNVQFAEAVTKGGEVGRRLNFLLQEMQREANTISSKSSETAIVHLAVDLKEEVERLREQVQNLA